MRRCGRCDGLSPMPEPLCLHCGETVAVERVTAGAVALIAAGSVLITSCLVPHAEYGAPCVDQCVPPDGVEDARVSDGGVSDGGVDGGP